MSADLDVMQFNSPSNNQKIDSSKIIYECAKKSLDSSQGIKMSKKSMPVKVRLDRIAALIGVCATVTASSIGLGMVGFNKAIDKYTIEKLSDEFHDDVIDPNTFSTQDKMHFYYDYNAIALDVINMKDEMHFGIYFLYHNMSRYIDGVIEQIHNNLEGFKPINFEEYIKYMGYENIDAYEKDMRRQIALDARIDKQQNKPENMREEHYTNDSNFK